MTCNLCPKESNAYDFNCLGCCARLVKSAKPSQTHAKSLLAAVERFPGSPTRDEILEKLKNEAV